MRFEIYHKIDYSYSKPVFLEPLTVRLRPRSDWFQQVTSYQLEVDPSTDGMTECVDIDGNDAAELWFSGLHRSLSLRSKAIVDVRQVSPFMFIVTDDSALNVPVTYSKPYNHALKPYIKPLHKTSALDRFTQLIAEEVDRETVPFLTNLAYRIHSDFKWVARKEGACRDLALLFIEACRRMGLAARFVSGYAYSDGGDSTGQQEMHAWAEVYLPGGGWRGFDPSLGLAVSGHHVAVAAGADPINASPTSGAFRGSGTSAKQKYELSIKERP